MLGVFVNRVSGVISVTRKLNNKIVNNKFQIYKIYQNNKLYLNVSKN